MIILDDILKDIKKISRRLPNTTSPIEYNILTKKLEQLEGMYLHLTEILETK